MTLAELKSKYNLGDGAKHEPKADCRFCRGTGEKIVWRTGKLTFCICLFVDHDASDDVGEMLATTAKNIREQMKGQK